MNIVSLAVLAIVVIFAIHGMKKGFISQLAPILSVILSALLVNYMLPVVTGMIRENTPVYSYALEWSRDAIEKQTEQFLQQEGIAAEAAYTGSLTKIQQTGLIRSLPVPDFVGKLIESYNNSEGYRRLGVSSFVDYLAGCIASLALNVVSFLVVMLVTFLIVRAVIGSLKLFSRLPVLGLGDRLGGLIAGALRGVFIVWILMMVISAFSGTQIGASVMDQIDKSFALWPIYQSNVFLKIVRNAVSRII